MNETLLLYLFTRLDAVLALFAVLLFTSLIGGLFTAMAWHIEESETARKMLLRVLLPVAVVSCLGVVLIPDKKDMAIIVGGTLAVQAAKSEKGQAFAGELYDAVMAQLRKASGKEAK